jgi:hypothetical protein
VKRLACALFFVAASVCCFPAERRSVRASQRNCESVCRHLAYLHCPIAMPASPGHGCVDFCLPKWDLACIERAESCSDANRCVDRKGSVSLEIGDGLPNESRIVLQHSHAGVAGVAKDAADTAGRMVVVNVPLPVLATGGRRETTAHSADAALFGEQPIEFIGLDSVLGLQHEPTVTTGVVPAPSLGGACRRAPLHVRSTSNGQRLPAVMALHVLPGDQASALETPMLIQASFAPPPRDPLRWRERSDLKDIATVATKQRNALAHGQKVYAGGGQ